MAYTYKQRTGGIVHGEVSGLDHLEGLTATVIVDGKVIGDYVVTSGTITLPVGLLAAYEIIVGLDYECEFETLPMMIQSAQGIAFGQHKRITNVGFYLYQALGLSLKLGELTEDQWNFRTQDTRIDQSPPLYSGYKEEIVEGTYTEETTIIVKQTQPFPLNINLMQITIDQSF